MFEINQEFYYIDFSEINKVIALKEVLTENGESDQTINYVSFEIIKIMLEVIMSEREEIDSNLGVIKSDNFSIPFRIAFNTLLKNNILKTL